MKKGLILLCIVFVVGLVWSQTSIQSKQKQTIAKDTVKKNKTIAADISLVTDSISTKPFQLKAFKKSVIASYYADKFNGRRTTSGKKFSNYGYTAAHKKLPFGTKLKVTNEANGKSVIVEITDRGPFVRSKEIDLTKRAFMDLADNKRSGMLRVKIEIIEN
jgi:rare lipoprotein A